jgi:hypothetical protein
MTPPITPSEDRDDTSRRRESEYRLIVREYTRLRVAVESADPRGVLQVLSDDLSRRSASFKMELCEHFNELRDDPGMRNFYDLPPSAEKEVIPGFLLPDFIGADESIAMLGFHKSQEYSKEFAQLINDFRNRIHKFSQQVVRATLQYGGEIPFEVYDSLQATRKDLKSHGLALAGQVYLTAMQFPETRGGPREATDYVSLADVVVIAPIAKSTLYDWSRKGQLPPPAKPGSGRRPNLWLWSTLRPELEKLAGIALPKCLPRN